MEIQPKEVEERTRGSCSRIEPIHVERRQFVGVFSVVGSQRQPSVLLNKADMAGRLTFIVLSHRNFYKSTAILKNKI